VSPEVPVAVWAPPHQEHRRNEHARRGQEGQGACRDVRREQLHRDTDQHARDQCRKNCYDCYSADPKRCTHSTPTTRVDPRSDEVHRQDARGAWGAVSPERTLAGTMLARCSTFMIGRIAFWSAQHQG
jgi:hypothetical protein